MGKKLVILVLALVLCLGAFSVAHAGTPTSFVVLPDTMGGLNVRSGPGTNYSVAGWVISGDEIDLVKIGTTWTKITVIRSGKTGYIKNNYIADLKGKPSPEPAPSPQGAGQAARVSGASVNIRTGAGTGYAKIATLSSGTKLKILGSAGNWYHVTVLSSGKSGWVSKTYVKLGFTSTTTARVNLRASANGKLIKTLAKGTSVSVSSISGSWSKVKAGSSSGYVYSKYLK